MTTWREAKQAGSIIAAGVEQAAESLEDRGGQGHGRTAVKIALEFLLEERDQHPGHPFGGLERDVADETVAHHHVDIPAVDVVALDVTDVVEPAFAQQGIRRLHLPVALDVLLADIEQADPGAGIIVKF